MFKSTGTLIYEPDHRLVMTVDPGLTAYYRSMIPKSMPVQKPRWPAHATVVRTGKETPVHLQHWGKYEGEEVEFSYDPDIKLNRTYYWLNVWCDRLADIREELGLKPKSRWTKPPSGFHQCFHVTVANKKNT
jgi:hypothetical protein